MYWFFPGNYQFSIRVLRAIGNSSFGAAEFGEIAKVVEQITPGDFDSWCRQWTALGDKCMDEGAAAEKAGNMATSWFAYCRAVTYYQAAQFFLPFDHPKKISLYKKMLESFEKGTRGDKPTPERVHVPYEDSFLYAYFVPTAVPDADGRRSPTIVWFGGLDSTAEEVYFCIAKDLSKRGMNVLVVDGPGQGASMRLNNIRSRYDYEAAGTAAFDYLLTRPDVDPERIGLMSWSLGGYYGPRAVAFEPRFKALVTYGAMYDYGEVWAARPDDHPMMPYIKWIFNQDTVEGARAEVNKFNFRHGELENIKCPVLICHCDTDQQQNSRENAKRLFDGITNSPDKTFYIFTAEEGGSEHCSGDNMTHANAVAGDWLRKTFGIK